MLKENMKPEFKKSLIEIRKRCGFKSPVVPFSSETRKKVKDISVIEHFEGMVTLMECHPLFAHVSLNSDLLDFRKYLSYEIIIRQIGHSRSVVANANALNHIGTAVAFRSMIELYAFTIFITDTDTINDERLIEKLLYGGTFLSGDLIPYEKSWKENEGKEMPNDAKKLLKKMLETPFVGTYLKHAKLKDSGFDQMYATYCNYTHPTFSVPRDQLLEDINYSKDFFDALEDNEYYHALQKNTSPVVSIERDLKASSFCLELFWPEVLKIDPVFDEKLDLNPFKNKKA